MRNLFPRPKGSRFIQIRQELLDICAGDHCCAALLWLFEYWTSAAMDQTSDGTEPWMKGSRARLEYALFSMYSGRRIQDRVQWLIEANYVITRAPTGIGDERVYLLNWEEVSDAINDLSHGTNVRRTVGQMSGVPSDKCPAPYNEVEAEIEEEVEAPLPPHRDEDGRCSRCGLEWPDEMETLEPHECPPGFTAHREPSRSAQDHAAPGDPARAHLLAHETDPGQNGADEKHRRRADGGASGESAPCLLREPSHSPPSAAPGPSESSRHQFLDEPPQGFGQGLPDPDPNFVPADPSVGLPDELLTPMQLREHRLKLADDRKAAKLAAKGHRKPPPRPQSGGATQRSGPRVPLTATPESKSPAAPRSALVERLRSWATEAGCELRGNGQPEWVIEELGAAYLRDKRGFQERAVALFGEARDAGLGFGEALRALWQGERDQTKAGKTKRQTAAEAEDTRILAALEERAARKAARG